jgi:hypothetical protein
MAPQQARSPSPLPSIHQPVDGAMDSPESGVPIYRETNPLWDRRMLDAAEPSVVPRILVPETQADPPAPRILAPDNQPEPRAPRVPILETQPELPSQVPDTQTEPPFQRTANAPPGFPLSSASSVIELSSAQRPQPQPSLQSIATCSISLGEPEPYQPPSRPLKARTTRIDDRSSRTRLRIQPTEDQSSVVARPSARPVPVPVVAQSSAQAGTSGQPQPSSTRSLQLQGNLGIMRPRATLGVPSRRISELRTHAQQIGAQLSYANRQASAAEAQAKIAAIMQCLDEMEEDPPVNEAGPSTQSRPAPTSTQTGPAVLPAETPGSGPSRWTLHEPATDLVPDDEEARVAAEAESKGKEPVSANGSANHKVY